MEKYTYIKDGDVRVFSFETISDANIFLSTSQSMMQPTGSKVYIKNPARILIRDGHSWRLLEENPND